MGTRCLVILTQKSNNKNTTYLLLEIACLCLLPSSASGHMFQAGLMSLKSDEQE
jgi:hypothetical protein